jgi:hypothetical protein
MKKPILLLLLFCIILSTNAQKKSKFNSTTSSSYDFDSVLYTNLKYREIGPFRGGRSAAVVGDLNQKNVFYMGATGCSFR